MRLAGDSKGWHRQVVAYQYKPQGTTTMAMYGTRQSLLQILILL